MTPAHKAQQAAAVAMLGRSLVDAIGKFGALQCGEPMSCIAREKARTQRGYLRPMWAFDIDRLCRCCRAYVYAAMASMELDSLERSAAEEARAAKKR
jgi:hypothetical protein